MNCCNKPKFKLESSEKLKSYHDTRQYKISNKMIYCVGGELLNREFQEYIIFCENCGHLERKGEI